MPHEIRLFMDPLGFTSIRTEMLPGMPPPMADMRDMRDRGDRGDRGDMRAMQPPPKKDNENFFRSLPAESFRPEELDLRDAIVTALQSLHGKAATNRVAGIKEVKLAREWLPRGVMLEEWVERRMGSEVLIYEENKGGGKGSQQVFKLPPISKEERDAQRDSFFDQLPAETFSPEEMRLREQILDYLDSKPGEVVTLSHLGGDKMFAAAKRALLPENVPLKEWVERRASLEFALESSPKGQWVIRYIGEPADQGDFQPEDAPAEEAPYEDEAKRAEKQEKKEAEDLARIEQREQWFGELPTDSLNDAEADLRQALVDFIDRWNRSNDSPPTLSNAGSDEGVRKGRAGCLPKFVSLRDWIESRIGGEMELIFTEGTSEVFFGIRGEINQAKLDKAIANLKVSKRGRIREAKGKGKDGGKDGGGGGRGRRRERGPRGPAPQGKGGGPPPKRRRM